MMVSDLICARAYTQTHTYVCGLCLYVCVWACVCTYVCMYAYMHACIMSFTLMHLVHSHYVVGTLTEHVMVTCNQVAINSKWVLVKTSLWLVGHRLVQCSLMVDWFTVYMSMSGQSLLDICGNNFILGIITTAGITLCAIEHICPLSTVLEDSFSVAGILWCDGIRD